MAKIGISVLAGTEGSGDLGRVVNALETAKEFHAAGDDVEPIFDGAGTQWIKELGDEDHRYHGLYMEVQDAITGACHYCSKAYGVYQRSKMPASTYWTNTTATRAFGGWSPLAISLLLSDRSVGIQVAAADAARPRGVLVEFDS